MTIQKHQDDCRLTLDLIGRLDSTTASMLEDEISASISGVSELILNFAALDYISSAGLRVLLKAQKMMTGHGSMKVIHVNDMVAEVFNITGFSDILTIE